LKFGEDINIHDLVFQRDGNSLIIGIQETNVSFEQLKDVVTLEDWFFKNNKIETFELRNGTSFNGFIINEQLHNVRTITQTLDLSDIIDNPTSLQFSIFTEASHGTVTVDQATGEWEYTVEGSYIGKDSAIIQVEDSEGNIYKKAIALESFVSDPSIISENSVVLMEDNQYSLELMVDNPVGGALTYEVISSNNNCMTMIDTNGVLTYIPNENYNGTDSVEIKVTNAYGLSTTQTITFEIEAVNDTPDVEVVSNYSLSFVNFLEGDLGATDVDGDQLAYTLTTQPTYGTLTVAEDGSFTYETEGNYSGSDSAVVTIDDGNGGVVTKTLNFELDFGIFGTENIDRLDQQLDSDDVVYALAGSDSVSTGAGNDTIYAHEGDDNVFAGSGDDTLFGNEGQDFLYGDSGNDMLYGNQANDRLYGGEGNDTLVGGEGSDILGGNEGDDTYYYALGDGHDTIINYVLDASDDMDKVVFDENISKNDILSVERKGNDLTIIFNEYDSLTITNWFDAQYADQLDQLVFHDGVVSLEEMSSLAVIMGTDDRERLDQEYETSDIVYALGGSDDIYTGAGDDTIFAGTGTDDVFAGSGNDLLYGDTGNDFLYGDLGDDTLFGEDGRDRLYSGEGNDHLTGGQGDDKLSGGSGDDVYYYALGDGHDTIYNMSPDSADTDKIVFDQTMSKNDMFAERDGDDLVIRFNVSDSITIQHWFDESFDYKIDQFVFSDGTLNADEIKAYETIYGTNEYDRLQYHEDQNYIFYVYDGNDSLESGSGDDIAYLGNGSDSYFSGAGEDTIFGEAGNDFFYSGDGDDLLYGNEGNDRIYGGNDNDHIYGGTGYDQLNGGNGDDTYYYSLGDGHNKITNNNTSDSYFDKVVFGEGINLDDIVITKDSNDLVLTINSTDKVTVRNWFHTSYDYKLDQFVFQDGVLNAEDVRAAEIIYGTNEYDRLQYYEDQNYIFYVYDGNDSLESGGGDDIAYLGNGSDSIFSGAGDDTLYGEAGNDFFSGGDGQDIIYGGEGNDRFYGGNGDDHLYGGSGYDQLNGGDGDDIYYYNEGDEHNRIVNYSSSSAYSDQVLFGENITKDMIGMRQNGNDLIVALENSDKLTMYRWFDERYDYQVDKLVLQDGSYLTSDDINKIIQDMNSYAVNEGIAINSNSDVKNNNELMNIIVNSWQS
jgi:VCBS repeat-containing protein